MMYGALLSRTPGSGSGGSVGGQPPSLQAYLMMNVPYVGSFTALGTGSLEPRLTALGYTTSPASQQSVFPNLVTCTGPDTIATWSELMSRVEFDTGGSVSPTAAGRYSATHALRFTYQLYPTGNEFSFFSVRRTYLTEFDAYHRAIARRAGQRWPRGGIYAAGWEYTANWYAWGFSNPRNHRATDAEDFVFLYRRLAAIWREEAPLFLNELNFATSDNVNPGFPNTTFPGTRGPTVTAGAYWPGDDVVDIFAVQGYARARASNLSSSTEPQSDHPVHWWPNARADFDEVATNGVIRPDTGASTDFPTRPHSFEKVRQWALGTGPSTWLADLQPGIVRSGLKPLYCGECGIRGSPNWIWIRRFGQWVDQCIDDGTMIGHSYFDWPSDGALSRNDHRMTNWPELLPEYPLPTPSHTAWPWPTPPTTTNPLLEWQSLLQRSRPGKALPSMLYTTAPALLGPRALFPPVQL